MVHHPVGSTLTLFARGETRVGTGATRYPRSIVSSLTASFAPLLTFGLLARKALQQFLAPSTSTATHAAASHALSLSLLFFCFTHALLFGFGGVNCSLFEAIFSANSLKFLARMPL